LANRASSRRFAIGAVAHLPQIPRESHLTVRCRTRVRFGVVEAVNGNIRLLINCGRGYKNLGCLLLKVKRLTVTNVEFVAVRSVRKAA